MYPQPFGLIFITWDEICFDFLKSQAVGKSPGDTVPISSTHGVTGGLEGKRAGFSSDLGILGLTLDWAKL